MTRPRKATADRIGLPENLTWRRVERQWMTPNVLGPRPGSLVFFDGDNDRTERYRRADIQWDHEARTLNGEVTLIHDLRSGEVFELWRDQPCGGGCYCAATIVHRPDVLAHTS